MDDALITDAWKALRRLADADRVTAKYTWWAKVNLEPDASLVMINERVFRAALRDALADIEIADFIAFLAILERKAADRRRTAVIMADPDERTAEW